jgi:hypothetical protein
MRSPIFSLLFTAIAGAGELPVFEKVEVQPLYANAARVLESLEILGEPLVSEADQKAIRSSKDSTAIQRILDRYVLIGLHINPESRVKVQQGSAPPELVEQGWRTFLVKVMNEAGVTAVLAVDSPNAGQLANSPSPVISRRFLDLQLYRKQPMKAHLTGLEVEYAILQIYSRDAGKRDGKLIFDIGAGAQDPASRDAVDVLFTARPATKVTFRVLDSDDTSTTAAFVIRDSHGRVYPSQAKRVAPDFFFHPQVYRSSGEGVMLPAGEYSIAYQRGPEYQSNTQKLLVEPDKPLDVVFRLERWIDPAKLNWFSGDHHVHAAGCSHYEKPTEGVYPKDMIRHIVGEDLKVGSVLTWGPGWYFQKTFFEGKDNKLSTQDNLMRYDVEVSGFPSSHTGHIVLLGLKDQDYPGTKRIEDWPSYGIPVFRWAKSQGAVTGFAHSGWGLAVKQEKLLTEEIPPFDGIGANEFIVGVTHDLVDFISTVDTPYAWELNIWYHTLNAGYRTRISGETDFPCIYDEKVGLGRSYVRQKKLDFQDWINGIREGRAYVSDGKSHLIDFEVNGLPVGEKGSELRVKEGEQLNVKAKVAAMLPPARPGSSLGPYDQKPYWDLERARIGDTRRVAVELIVNGEPVAKREIEADGELRPVEFTHTAVHSGWVALRILPSSHTNPIFVLAGDKPIRVKKSLEWCLKAVDQCWQQKTGRIRLEERGEAERAYDFARSEYKKRLAEAR